MKTKGLFIYGMPALCDPLNKYVLMSMTPPPFPKPKH